MPRMPGVPFIRPRSFSRGRPGGPPRFIVIHYTAGSEGPTAAEDGVAYDQRRTDGTSTHFFTDRNSIIQCVDTNDRSHAALYYGNLWGIHIEQCATAQSREQWLDPASRATIRNTAKVCAWAMRAHGIPLARLVGRQMRTGKGFGGHKDVTLGFPEDGGTHKDPDGNRPGSYPYDVLVANIKAALAGTTEEDDMDQNTPVTGAVDVTIGTTPAKDITRPLRWWLSAPYSHIIGLEAKIAELEKSQSSQGKAVQLNEAQLNALADKVAARLAAAKPK